MKRLGRRPVTVPMLCSLAIGSMQSGCGYGFGNHEFRGERAVAIAFAQALQVGDTARMRQLSWGSVNSNVPAIARETPRAYTAFAKPTPQLLTVGTAGGIYGGSGTAEFLVASGPLDSCHGGVQLFVLLVKKSPKIASMRLVPPLDSLGDDACRAAIDRS